MYGSIADARIVVVDDDAASLRLIEQVLAGDGYTRVALTSDPRTVKDHFAPAEPDLVLLDLHMPHVDGFELLERLAMLVPGDSFVPFLMLTADASPETRLRALRLGATDFLTKPIDIAELRLRVTRLLETRRLTVELAREREMLATMVAEQTQELRTANRELQRLVKAKDEFVASVSHELRTPLTAVVGFAQELAEYPEHFDTDEGLSMVRLIAAQSRDVAAIIDDLLVAARAEIGRVKLLSERVDLLVEVEAARQSLSDRAGAISVPRDTAVAIGDRLRVRQIVRNLLANAVRHGGPEVVVELLLHDEMVGVSVADNGPGIPPELRAHIFEAYFHGEGNAGQPASIGLGLTVSRQLARMMGGDLTYQDLGGGSLFQLFLPGGAES
jgi:signal transduction histidine kinase